MCRFLSLVCLLAVVAMAISEDVKEGCKKRPEGNGFHCCAMPIKNLDKITKCLQDQKGDKDAGCSSSCFFDGIEVVKDGKVDRPTLLATVKTLFEGTDHGFEALHEQAVDHCSEKYAKMVEEKGGKMNPNCNRSKSAVAWCLHGFYFKNCPAAIWTSSDECNAFKKYATDCAGIHHGHHGRKPAE